VRLNNLTLSYAQGSPDLAQLDRLLDEGPMKPWKGVPVEEGHDTVPPDMSGFKVLCDSRITDLRVWDPDTVGEVTKGAVNPNSRVYTYRRLSVMKKQETKGRTFFHVRLILLGSEGEVRFPGGQALPAKVVKTTLDAGKAYRWDAIFDFTKAPAETPIDLIIEFVAPGAFLRGSGSSTGMAFGIEAETAEFTQWVLMPKGRDYKSYRYVFYKKDQPDTAEDGHFFTEYLAKDYTVLAFKLLSLDPGYEHEVFWNYQ
jgi:hypothetical protein